MTEQLRTDMKTTVLVIKSKLNLKLIELRISLILMILLHGRIKEQRRTLNSFKNTLINNSRMLMNQYSSIGRHKKVE